MKRLGVALFLPVNGLVLSELMAAGGQSKMTTDLFSGLVILAFLIYVAVALIRAIFRLFSRKPRVVITLTADEAAKILGNAELARLLRK
jgi:hypothetical protein